MGYVKRSFCVIELYAAVLGNCKLALASPAESENDAREMLMTLEPGKRPPGGWYAGIWNGPIDARAAQTGNIRDKQLIDSYVEKMDGGFDRLNATTTEAIIKAANHLEHRDR